MSSNPDSPVIAPLPSWNEGATKTAIFDFVRRVTTEGSPDYVPLPERIATFDNDGTLWCEKPIPIELDFILQRLAGMAEKDASLRDRQPWKSAYEKDFGWLSNAITKHYHGDDSDVKVVIGGVLKSFEGMDVEDYQASASEFLHSAQNPKLKRPYLSTAYTPMLELLRYLEANGFTTYIASGGDRDFMRPITEGLYGIPFERVVGSSNALRYQSDEGGGSIVYLAQPDVFDDGPAKPVRIWSRIGRRPIFAGGKSNGDIQMLEYVSSSSRPSFSMLIKHDDDEREIAYTAGAEKSLDEARQRGWVIVSVKNDWKQVF
ncbi:HAD family hydrolase [Chlorogloeopsis sp. ULAP02]|uniref:HAD family hydrolase n=1 Tax=Chlorogloeopsis sp. ULAP02 TaxID=3107926 RepID=UPI00398B54ED